MKLRYYQQEAVEAVWDHLANKSGHSCVVLPTAAGKTPVIATLAKEVAKAGDRVLILAHVKELLAQSAEKLNAICPDVNFGIHSAGLGSRDTEQQVIIAGIQSVYNKADMLGAFDMVIIDEVHLLPNEGNGMYRTLLFDLKKMNPHLYVVGLTATPYRLSSGYIYGPDQLFESICYEISIPTLIANGYLSELTSKSSRQENNTESLHIQRGEFVPSELDNLFADQKKVANACHEIVESTRDRNSVLIFCTGIKHAQMVCEDLSQRDKNHETAMIDGNTPSLFRDEIIERFRNKEIKYLVNVNVLTTGFDAPNIDCVVMLRATMSPGLYYQCLGRGFRICNGKKDCLILDFGNNIIRHGPVDSIRIRDKNKSSDEKQTLGKKCPDCLTVTGISARTCPDCGYAFPVKKRLNHENSASEFSPLSGKENPVEEFDIIDTSARVHFKKGNPNAYPSMCVSYTYSYVKNPINQWLCFSHQKGSYPNGIARRWWLQASSSSVPDTTEEAVEKFNAGFCANIKKIKAKLEGKFYRIIDIQFGEKPDITENENELDEVPF